MVFPIIKKLFVRLGFDINRVSSPNVNSGQNVQGDNNTVVYITGDNVSLDSVSLKGDNIINNNSENKTRKPIHLSSLVSPSEPVLRNREFVDEEIWGPSLLAPLSGCEISGCSWAGTKDSLFWEVKENTFLIGVVGAVNCKFIRCDFKGIALVGSDEAIKKYKKGFGLEV